MMQSLFFCITVDNFWLGLNIQCSRKGNLTMKKQLFLGLSALLLLASCGGTPETSALDSSVAGSDSSSLPVSSEPISSSEPINSAAMLDGFITKVMSACIIHNFEIIHIAHNNTEVIVFIIFF